MNRERISSMLLAAVAAVAVAVQPVAAQTSTSDAAISALNNKLLVVAIPITILVEAVLIYTVFKYKDSDEAKPTRENRRLEITWTIATAAVLLFVGISASITMADDSVITPQNVEEAPDEAQQINVTAYRYAWDFTYTSHNVTLSSNQQPLYMVQGEETWISLSTNDWLHAFHVPAMGLKHDAVPGKIAWLKTTPTEVDTHQGYCAEYCGVGHSAMTFEVQVVENEEALVENLREVCNSRDQKSWNNDSNTCEWTGGNESDGGDGSDGDDENVEHGDASAIAPASGAVAGGASSAVRAV